jgi:hypothetical protein
MTPEADPIPGQMELIPRNYAEMAAAERLIAAGATGIVDVTVEDDPEPEPPWGPPPSAEQLAEWALQDAIDADHDTMVPARDQAEREAYDQIEERAAVREEAAERHHHFHGTWVSDIPPHEYQCEDGCVYETGAERDERIAMEDRIAELEAEAAAELDEGIEL